ncbi:beta-ketoacyl-[acyl-carrier-protein] synthase family protein [Mucilaginibacter koreensis]
MSKVVITGMGIITAIGSTVGENHAALAAGRSGITRSSHFPSKFSGQMPFGEVPVSTDELKAQLQVTELGVTRTTLLALHAFKEAIADAGLTSAQLASSHTALVNATTVGGMCLTEELYANGNGKAGNEEYLASYDYASVSLFLQENFQIEGVLNTINTACSSSANAIIYGARLLNNGLANRVIVGGVDSLSKFTVNGFNALRILSDEPCKPFDAQRKGLNLGEGAAYLVLERAEDVAGKKIYAELSGYGNTNDAYHPSSLCDDGEGPYLSMQEALHKAHLMPADIDYVNTHGTSTENNDEVELQAMRRLFNQLPKYNSTKAYTGHTLGAASAVEAVFSILTLQYQEIYLTLNFKQSAGGENLSPVTQYQQLPVHHVMSNSFGFGGSCTSLIFSKV